VPVAREALKAVPVVLVEMLIAISITVQPQAERAETVALSVAQGALVVRLPLLVATRAPPVRPVRLLHEPKIGIGSLVGVLGCREGLPRFLNYPAASRRRGSVAE